MSGPKSDKPYKFSLPLFSLHRSCQSLFVSPMMRPTLGLFTAHSVIAMTQMMFWQVRGVCKHPVLLPHRLRACRTMRVGDLVEVVQYDMELQTQVGNHPGRLQHVTEDDVLHATWCNVSGLLVCGLPTTGSWVVARGGCHHTPSLLSVWLALRRAEHMDGVTKTLPPPPPPTWAIACLKDWNLQTINLMCVRSLSKSWTSNTPAPGGSHLFCPYRCLTLSDNMGVKPFHQTFLKCPKMLLGEYYDII